MKHQRVKLLPILRNALALGAMGLGLGAAASPLLRCHVSYAGSAQVIEATPVADPYPVASVDIGGRFRFKAVMVGDGGRIRRIVLYAYVYSDSQPVLIQQTTYLPPFAASATPLPLTGEQRLYAGPMERELGYYCTLEGVAL